MNKLVPILLLLLAGCEARDDSEAGQTIALQNDLLANLENASTDQDPARIQALIDRAMPAALPAAAKAQYRNVRGGVGGSACGEVAIAEGKGKAGSYRPFVVTPDAVAIIGTGAAIKFNDPSDFLADAWIRWCATNDELKLVEGQLDEGPALIPEAQPGGEFPPIAEPPALPMPKQEPPRRTASAPPPPQIDSFSKSVSRPE